MHVRLCLAAKGFMMRDQELLIGDGVRFGGPQAILIGTLRAVRAVFAIKTQISTVELVHEYKDARGS